MCVSVCTCVWSVSVLVICCAVSCFWQTSYGPADRYKAGNCTVLDHDLLSCYTVQGVGSALPWAVYVAGQRSSELVTSFYAPPLIDSNANQSTGVTNGGFAVCGL